jgi:hypothetical protein
MAQHLRLFPGGLFSRVQESPRYRRNSTVGCSRIRLWRELPAMKVIWASLFLILTTAFNASRVSGTYVCHGPGFAVMLQLTATQNGGIDGVFSSVEMKYDGSIRTMLVGTVEETSEIRPNF